VKKVDLDQLPTPPMVLSDPHDKALHDHLAGLVERMLELHKRLTATTTQAEQDLYQRQIEATDWQIDALVYDLYGLTDEEIAVVEG
jgi:hypothetical protein